MWTLIQFELRKILDNRAGMIACLLALAAVVGLSALNLLTFGMRDYDTGEYVTGIAAQQAYRAVEETHAGTLDDEHVAADAAALGRANQLADETPGFYELSSEQIIERYGLGFWQQSMGALQQNYYMEVVGTLDSGYGGRATSLKEGALARLDGAFEAGFMNYFPYSDAEQDFWQAKVEAISWPVEYGYAGGWKNALNWSSFLGLCIVALCIALSGTFAGEYQARTAAVVLPTRRGKRALPVAKVAAAGIFATAYWFVCAAAVTAINVGICGAEGWDLPLQVAFGFGNPYPFTIGQTVLAHVALGWLVSMGMAALTLLLSAKMRSTMPVAVIPMAVAFLGLFALFITPLAKVASLTPIAALDYAFARIASYAAGPVVLDLPALAALLYAAMLLVLTPLACRTFRRHQAV